MDEQVTKKGMARDQGGFSYFTYYTPEVADSVVVERLGRIEKEEKEVRGVIKGFS